MSDCAFCRIAARQIPAEIVYEDEHCAAFHDINPQAPYHLLIVPKRHLVNLNEVTAEDEELLGHLCRVAGDLAREHGFASGGYRVVFNSGSQAGQSVWHLHLHVLGGRAMRWPPG